ncbi:type III-B CRISPR module RAMP protein Cmr6 [Methylococcus sp. Mc7]|uniref:type III-B CRISPR module RAMP protein Cmr6 n=1 Tax=Methylococcus sp. Mc7 TaxID=2860258 RepID=UPI001C53268A|nr:type III-B CRISPR module RAMP protein Cmr6 [Methylococcus sp. Mc7]QXP83815.1 type III-B CRISPR module RAMP protein Cmr6 [Methylococcus sp. Mc7]
MSIAAVPKYLQGKDPEFYLSAPPGHRFLLYFAAWGENRETGKVDWRTEDRVPKMKRRQGQLVQDGWDDVTNAQFACTIAACKTPPFDEDKPRARRPKADPGFKHWNPMMEALLSRQTAATAQIGDDALLRLEALAIASFTTGLGNEHPLENGFAFLNPYGLPYLPGSGVKGVLRQAARELASGEWGETHGWDEEHPHPKSLSQRERDLAEGEGLSVVDILFGLESKNGDTEHLRGALTFWDVIPQIKGDSLMVEIMTPHQKHYYQDGQSPHDSGQPTPISFLTVPPGSGFTFHVQCDLAHLKRLAPELATDGQWQKLIEAAFEHAFQWLGFGAKTAVGYGAMRRDQEAEAKAAKARAERTSEAQRQATLDTMSPNLRQVEALRAEIEKRLAAGRKLPVSDQFWGGSIKKLALNALDNTEWTAEERIALANMLEAYAGRLMALDTKDLRKQLKLSALRGSG